MAFSPIHLSLAPTLHIHPSGAVTYLGLGEEVPEWDGDAALLALVA